MGDYIGDYYRVFKGDTRSLDKGSYDNGPLTPFNGLLAMFRSHSLGPGDGQ